MAKVKRAALRFPKSWMDFTIAQRTAFQRLGLYQEQIERLRQRLPYIRIDIEPPPPIGPVRERLMKLEALLHDAERALRELLEPFDTLQTGQHPATAPSKRTRAAQRAANAILSVTEDGEVLIDARDAVKAARLATELARKKLPAQSRSVVAWRAVGAIEAELQNGFREHWNAKGLGLVHRGGGNRPFTPFPAYPDNWHASRSGDFAEIVGICWEAAGSAADPDRAIRKHLNREAAIKRLEHERWKHYLGDDDPPVRKRGRRKKYSSARSRVAPGMVAAVRRGIRTSARKKS